MGGVSVPHTLSVFKLITKVAGHVILDLSLLNQVLVNLPDTTGQTLQDSFARLDLRTGSSSKRPSLATSHESSDRSSGKSSAPHISDGKLSEDGTNSEGSRGKRRLSSMRALDGDESSRSSSHTGSSSSSNGKDVVCDGPMSSSDSAGGSRSSGGHATTSTDATSPDGSDNPESSRKIPSPLQMPASSSASRTTYINPSPTASRASAFVPPSVGISSPSNAFPSSSSFNALSDQLVLNTIPDPPPYTLVTFGAGVDSKLLDATTAASPYGAYYVPTSAFPVGAGQFITGGFGFIGRKHGLAMDCLVEVELVLADGRIVWVGEGGKFGGEWREDEDPGEVWWAVRGAGPVLGVVTRFRAKGFYLPSVFAGNFIL